MQETSTRSPTFTVLTPAPTASTVPTASWPRIRPSVTAGTSPLRMCRSVPQIVTASTRTMASVSSTIVGLGTSSQALRPGPWYTRARIGRLLLDCGGFDRTEPGRAGLEQEVPQIPRQIAPTTPRSSSRRCVSSAHHSHEPPDAPPAVEFDAEAPPLGAVHRRSESRPAFHAPVGAAGNTLTALGVLRCNSSRSFALSSFPTVQCPRRGGWRPRTHQAHAPARSTPPAGWARFGSTFPARISVGIASCGWSGSRCAMLEACRFRRPSSATAAVKLDGCEPRCSGQTTASSPRQASCSVSLRRMPRIVRFSRRVWLLWPLARWQWRQASSCR